MERLTHLEFYLEKQTNKQKERTLHNTKNTMSKYLLSLGSASLFFTNDLRLEHVFLCVVLSRVVLVRGWDRVSYRRIGVLQSFWCCLKSPCTTFPLPVEHRSGFFLREALIHDYKLSLKTVPPRPLNRGFRDFIVIYKPLTPLTVPRVSPLFPR